MRQGGSSNNTFIDQPSEPMLTRLQKKAKTSGIQNTADPYGDEDDFILQSSDSDGDTSYTYGRSKIAQRKSRS